jgi:hypothetical protein
MTALKDGNGQAAGGDLYGPAATALEHGGEDRDSRRRVPARRVGRGGCRALIYLWRKQVRSGAMPGVTLNEGGAAAFAPVTLVADEPAPAARPTERPHKERRRTGMVEVRLLNGRIVKAEASIAPDVLAAIVVSLDEAAV